MRFVRAAWATLESSAALEVVYFKYVSVKQGSVCRRAPLIFVMLAVNRQLFWAMLAWWYSLHLLLDE